MFFLFFLLSKLDKKSNKTDASSTKTTEIEDTSSQHGSSSGSNTNGDNSGSAEEASSDVVDTAGMTTKERNKAAALLASDIYLDSKQGSQHTNIGKIRVEYNSDYATGASLKVDGITMDAVLYNDGNQDDLKGVIGNIPLFVGIKKPDTTDQCKAILDEYIPDGTGRTAEWEEIDGFFIRKFSGYDTDDSCGVICYTVIPKTNSDTNLYVIVLTASKADTTITPLSEDSFHSMVDPVAALVPNSKLLITDYETAAKELKDIAYYETSNGESIGGLYELKQAARSWSEKVYGTDDPNTLTEEERKNKYWQYVDPEGYKEAQYYDAKEAAEERAGNSTQNDEDTSEGNSDVDDAEGIENADAANSLFAEE